MDPLHPLVPIQPAPPVPPDYTRIQRIERDHDRDAEPDWQRSPEDDAEDQEREQQFEDDYDPDWSDTTAAEAYDDHGALIDGATSDSAAEAGPEWNRRLQGERRARPQASEDPEDDAPGPHIDIIA
jgi:hypothetical protein